MHRQVICLLKSEFLWVVQLYRLRGIFPDASALITVPFIHSNPPPCNGNSGPVGLNWAFAACHRDLALRGD